MNENILQDLRSLFLERASLRNLPEKVWNTLSILNTYGTNAIEGNTLTLEEVNTVLVHGRTVPGRPVRDLMETVQHRQAFRGLVRRIDGPIDMICVLELHEEVFHGMLSDAGQWRRVNVAIAGAKHSPPRMENVIPMMERWCKELDQSDREGMETMEWVGRTHSSFESIHPFSDGNGRVGRLLMNLQLLKRNWPPVSMMPRDREDYIEALERADDGDLRPMRGTAVEVAGQVIIGPARPGRDREGPG